jgi:hypothetical protein
LISTPQQPEIEAFPLKELGSTYTMAQEAAWIDEDHYAVGRWDGSLSIFRFEVSQSKGPLISRAVNTPSEEGVQMICTLDGDGGFFSSNDSGSVIHWSAPRGDWSQLKVVQVLRFDEALGPANSGIVIKCDKHKYLVAGHASGQITIWCIHALGTGTSLLKVVDVRGPTCVNPWNLRNVRSLALLTDGLDIPHIVSGSEDGWLTVVRVPDGEIVCRTIYNPKAQRGINSVAARGMTILVANCAVGSSDFNLWSYRVDQQFQSIELRDSSRLIIDQERAQVFNFDVAFGPNVGMASIFFCSTEEGALWACELDAAGKVKIFGYKSITPSLGAALCFSDGRLAVSAYDLLEFVVDHQAVSLAGGGSVHSGGSPQPAYNVL